METTHTSAPPHAGITGAKAFKSCAEFYPFYLSEHSNRTCRRLHFAGSSLSLLCLAALVATRNPWWLLAGLAGLAAVVVASRRRHCAEPPA